MPYTITVSTRLLNKYKRDTEEYYNMPNEWKRKQRRVPHTPYCSLCKTPFTLDQMVLKTKHRLYCLDCEKKMFIDLPDPTDEELETFFKED